MAKTILDRLIAGEDVPRTHAARALRRPREARVVKVETLRDGVPEGLVGFYEGLRVPKRIIQGYVARDVDVDGRFGADGIPIRVGRLAAWVEEAEPFDVRIERGGLLSRDTYRAHKVRRDGRVIGYYLVA